MGNLSTRVMNMKFMKEENTNESHGENGNENGEKLHDSSKWKLPAASKLLSLANNNIVDTVGFGSIEQFKKANKYHGEEGREGSFPERQVFDQTRQNDDTVLGVDRIKDSFEKPHTDSKKRSFYKTTDEGLESKNLEKKTDLEALVKEKTVKKEETPKASNKKNKRKRQKK